MSISPTGPALVLVFEDRRRACVLLHPHDGGEQYMVPYLKKGIMYAKTHYESGNIVDVLLSEPESEILCNAGVLDTARARMIKHIYYLSYRWDSDSAKKVYHLKALHLPNGRYACIVELPESITDIPASAVALV